MLSYDGQTLLKIGSSTKVLVWLGEDSQGSLPPYLGAIRCASIPYRSQHLHGSNARDRIPVEVAALSWESGFLTFPMIRQSFPRILLPSHALVPVDSCLVSVVSSIERSPLGSFPLQHLPWRGVDWSNLWLVDWVVTAWEVSDPVPLRLGLINARSVPSKTFTLKDFFFLPMHWISCVWLKFGLHLVS